MELLNVMSVEEVKALISEKFSYKLDCESVNIIDSIGRVCSCNVKSNCNIPSFRRSTVDGFAVNSRDVFGASESMPSIMDLKEEVLMGKAPSGSISYSGECFYVPTGGMLPEGSDSVVMVEYSDRLDDSTILINSPSAPGDNVIQIGEDISLGEVVLEEGKKLRPYEIGVLASLGITELSVYKRPRIAIISTGDEIIPLEQEPEMGEIRDINTYLLVSSIIRDGGIPISYGIVKDEFELLKSTMDKALKECDIILISGGSSVGKKDQTLKVIQCYLAGEVLVHGMAVKPGKPTIVGKVEEKIIFGLPGHPLAASIIYTILVKDYMNKIMKYKDIDFGTTAEISINYHKAKGREEYLPVSLNEKERRIIADPVFGKSGVITTFSRAYGYIKIDKNVEGLVQGQKVQVYKL